MGSLQKLREAADAMGWSVGETLTRVGGTDHSPNFKCDLRLCGRAVACESAGSKQDAKERAANSALLSITEEPSSEFADMVAEMVHIVVSLLFELCCRSSCFPCFRSGGSLTPLAAGAEQVAGALVQGAATKLIPHSCCR